MQGASGDTTCLLLEPEAGISHTAASWLLEPRCADVTLNVLGDDDHDDHHHHHPDADDDDEEEEEAEFSLPED